MDGWIQYNIFYNTIFILPYTTITDGKKMTKIDERKEMARKPERNHEANKVRLPHF